MVNEEIFGGLRTALERGQSLQRAMMSFYNSGYKKEEIEEAAGYLITENQEIPMETPSNAPYKSIISKPAPVEKQEPSSNVYSPPVPPSYIPPPINSVQSAQQPTQPIQKPVQQIQKPIQQPTLPFQQIQKPVQPVRPVQQQVQPKPYLLPSQTPQQPASKAMFSPGAEFFHVKKAEILQSFQPARTIQKVSHYAAATQQEKAKNGAVIFVLILLLIFLGASLAFTLLFKQQVIDYISNFFK